MARFSSVVSTFLMTLALVESSSASAQSADAAAPTTPPASDTSNTTGGNLESLPDDEEANLLLDKKDPKAQQGVVIGSRGIDPGWKDSRVAERSPNLYGQTGILRVNSARANKSGYFDIGLHGRYFTFDNFIDPAAQDRNTFLGGTGSFGVSIFDIVEVGVAAAFATNENSQFGADDQAFTIGDIYPSVKFDLRQAFLGSVPYSSLPVAFGFDVRAFVPTQQGIVGADLGNFYINGTALFSVDMYEAYNWPIKLHFNGGYTQQFGGQKLTGVQGHLLAMTANQWFYSNVVYGAGLEIPLPYATPFVELWGQHAVGVPPGEGANNAADYNFADSHLILSPGVRFSVGRGLHFDVGADLGLSGTGGGFLPSIEKLVDGQPINPAWALQVGVSYTFSPFVAETQVEVRQKGKPVGQVRGCVVDAASGKPVQDSFVEFKGTAGPRIVVDDKGCFLSPRLDLGPRDIGVRHPDYEGGATQVEIIEDQVAETTIKLVPAPRYGFVKGNIANEQDEAVNGELELTPENGSDPVVATADKGTFDVKLVAPGKYRIVVKADGYLQQGGEVNIEPNVRTLVDFTLKKVAKKRISTLTKDKIEISERIPFDYDAARIKAEGKLILDEVVDLLIQNPQIKRIEVQGHTDSTGSAEYNRKLSADRAAAVVEYLIFKGVARERLVPKGYGPDMPLDPAKNEQAYAKNRRVEFIILEQDEGTGTGPTLAPAPK